MSDISSIFKDIETRLNGDKYFNLLYKSEVDVDVEDFHVQCDSKGPTVTILYGKFNTVFGGYTSQSWTSDNMRLKTDEKAFLFFKNDNAREECVFMPIKKGWQGRAITCDKNHGPTFGGGTWKWAYYDLQTFRKEKPKTKYEGKDTFIELNGHMCIGYAYGIDQPALSTRQEDINAKKLIVRKVEVYQVLDAFLKDQWRKQPSDKATEAMKTRLEHLEPTLGIRQYNILLVGIVGSGKSSFFNTLATIFEGEVKTSAPARSDKKSTTNVVHAYELKTKDKKQINLRIFDTRGFDVDRNIAEELRLLVGGRLQVGYQFPDQCPDATTLEKENVIRNSTLNDEIHLVCFISGTSNCDTLTAGLHKGIEDIQNIVSTKGLPMVVVATKIDQLCPKISEDADRVYTSSIVYHAVENISDYFGVQTSHIFPVVNYVNDSEIKPGKNRLALEALDTMARLITDYLEQHIDMPKYMDAWYKKKTELIIPHENGKKEVLMQMGAKLKKLSEKQLRVLCIGAVCSGKTSFIDSMASALRDEIYSKAAAGYGAGSVFKDSPESTTEKFQMYQMKYKHDSGELYDSNVYIGDTPGFQEAEGIQLDDIKFVVQGHVPNRFRIKKGIKRESKEFKQQPEKKDKVHCVCFVFDISTLNDLPKKLQGTFLLLKNWLRERGIPYVVIITKGDLLSNAVRKNKLCVFEDRDITQRKDNLIRMFDFKESRIFPVINYTNEHKVVPESDALLIEAFDKIRKYGEEYLEEIENEETDVNDGLE